MPTVATSPLTRTHSCDLAYFRSAGIFELIQFQDFRKIGFCTTEAPKRLPRTSISIGVPAEAKGGGTYPRPMPIPNEGRWVPLTTSPIFSAAPPVDQIE